MFILDETPISAKRKSVYVIIDIKKLLAHVSVKYLIAALLLSTYFVLCTMLCMETKRIA